MASTESRHLISCPNCGVKFAVASSLAGRRARCNACDTAFVVPALVKSTEVRPQPGRIASSPAASSTALVGFECRVCNTRLYGRVDHVGKKVKCPDCGAGTPIPEPEKPKPKNIPAALEGEQYELWDVDDQPLPSALMAAQPKYIAFQCSTCASLLHASYSQVGQQITCPDCGAKHTVPAAPKNTAKPSVLAPDRETPMLDPAAAPGERPHVVPHTLGLTLAEQEHEAEYKRALEKSERTGKPMDIDAKGRSIMPRWPLLTGVLPFLFSGGIPVACLGLSIGFYAAALVVVNGIELAMAGDMAAIAGMCFFAVGSVMTMLCTAACYSMLLQIIMESSEGNRRIVAWPGFMDWFGSLLYFFPAVMLSAVPGFAISHIPPLDSDAGYGAISIAASLCLFLPILVLSQLDFDSPWGVLSVRLLSSLPRCPFSWAFFYLESATLVAICGAATYSLLSGGARSVLWLMPIYVATAILWARLLGRLAWRLSETMVDEDSAGNDRRRPVGPKNYNPPRGRVSAN
jgi:DNA-directed RNA polymerase subunit RPC12/RpoP